jgi:hypothetical protein
MEERELEMKEAIASKDKELIEILQQEQEKQAEYFKRRDMEIQDLELSMERMHEEKIQRLEAAQPLYALTWPSSLGSGRRQPEQTPAKSRPITTNRSLFAIGATLSQNGHVTTISRSLTKEERNYDAAERELLGVVYALYCVTQVDAQQSQL